MDLSSGELESYFVRVKYADPCAATLAVLRDLQYRHAHTFPIENLNVLLGRGIRLDLEAIDGMKGAKAIVERCFPAGQNRVL